MKRCSKCRELKELILFSKKKTSGDGFKSNCKQCDAVNRLKNKQRDSLLKQNWVKNNKQRHLENTKRYYLNNKSKIDAWKKEYRRHYEFNRINTDLQHKIRNRIRARLHAFNKRCKTSTLDALGCSLHEFKQYIESKFQPGMTWDNWSRNGWHIDHIKPLSLFDLTDPEQLKQACHYTNLQPLWAKDNILKSNKVDS